MHRVNDSYHTLLNAGFLLSLR